MKKILYFFFLMKRVFFRSALALGCLPFFFSVSPAQATSLLILSEVATRGDTVTDEFIEIRNLSDAPVDLSGMQLRRRTSGGNVSLIKTFATGSSIPAQGYWLFAHSDGRYALPFADSEHDSSALADNNSIGLFTESGTDGILIDSVAWGTGSPFSPETPVTSNPPTGRSITRDLATPTWSVADTLTPTNSRGETWTPPLPETPDPLLPSLSPVRFNEVLANPVGDETAEFIELYNPSDGPIDITGYRLHDASKTGEYTFPPDSSIPSLGYFVLERTISKLSLNNTNETLSLFDATGAPIDSMTYLKTKEGISLNSTEAGWRGGTPTPGALNIVNTLPETKEKVPKKGYRGMAIPFNARGKDAERSILKYTWDFGDDHKSYKEKTEHRYEKNGTYQVTLTTTDGSDDVVEIFPLKITALPKPNVRITALVPNPSGKDSDAEWLMIENRGKKPVDLRDYGIATGWKKLSNHPIRESFVIPPQSEKKLTQEFSLFTLPNQKGKIELRAPDGKVLQDIKYKLSKSVAEDVVYRKEKGKRWEWDETPKNQTESLISGQAPENLSESLISGQVPAEDEEESTVTDEIPQTQTDDLTLEQKQSEPETSNEPTPTEPAKEEPSPEDELGDQAVLGVSTEIPLPDTPPVVSDAPLILWFKHFLMDWNARLNTWQNNKTAL